MNSNKLAAQRALQEYGLQKTQSMSDVSPHKMIALLFAGAVEKLGVMVLAMEQNNQQLKGECASKVIAIVNGMRDCLDMQQGSELVNSLNSLYSFAAKDIFRANYENDMPAVMEVSDMLITVQQSWNKMPQADDGQMETGAVPVAAVAETMSESKQAPVVEHSSVKTESSIRKPALGLRQSAFYS
jgi:flagellar protein FliS